MFSSLRSKSFLSGFFLGLLFFVTANVYTYDDGTGVFGRNGTAEIVECLDCLKQLGWPFRLHQSGTIMHVDQILWVGLSTDIFIAVCASTIVGALTHLGFNARNSSRA